MQLLLNDENRMFPLLSFPRCARCVSRQAPQHGARLTAPRARSQCARGRSVDTGAAWAQVRFAAASQCVLTEHPRGSDAEDGEGGGAEWPDDADLNMNMAFVACRVKIPSASILRRLVSAALISAHSPPRFSDGARPQIEYVPSEAVAESAEKNEDGAVRARATAASAPLTAVRPAQRSTTRAPSRRTTLGCGSCRPLRPTASGRRCCTCSAGAAAAQLAAAGMRVRVYVLT